MNKRAQEHVVGSPAFAVASLCLFLLMSVLSMMSAARPPHPEDVGVSARHEVNLHPAFLSAPQRLDHDRTGCATFDPPRDGENWPVAVELRSARELVGTASICPFHARGPPLA